MDADVYSNEVAVYLDKEEVAGLLLGESFYKSFKERDTGKEKIVDINGPQKLPEKEGEHYDDVLDALEEAYVLIESMRYSYDEINTDSFNADKIQNTYLYYKQIQEEYR